MPVDSKEIYDALLVSVGVVGISYASQKAVKMNLGVDMSLRGVAKLTAGIVASSMLVKYLQDKNFIPVNPMKKS